MTDPAQSVILLLRNWSPTVGRSATRVTICPLACRTSPLNDVVYLRVTYVGYATNRRLMNQFAIVVCANFLKPFCSIVLLCSFDYNRSYIVCAALCFFCFYFYHVYFSCYRLSVMCFVIKFCSASLTLCRIKMYNIQLFIQGYEQFMRVCVKVPCRTRRLAYVSLCYIYIFLCKCVVYNLWLLLRRLLV